MVNDSSPVFGSDMHLVRHKSSPARVSGSTSRTFFVVVLEKVPVDQVLALVRAPLVCLVDLCL